MSDITNIGCDCCLQLYDEVGFPFGDTWRATNQPDLVCEGHDATTGEVTWISADYLFRSPTAGRPIARNVLTAGKAWKVSTTPHFQQVANTLADNVRLGPLAGMSLGAVENPVEFGAVSGIYYELAYQTDGDQKWQLFKCDDGSGFTFHADTGFVTTDDVGFRHAKDEFHALTAAEFLELFGGGTFTPNATIIDGTDLGRQNLQRWFQNATTGKFVYNDSKPGSSANHVTIGNYGGAPIFSDLTQASNSSQYRYVIDDSDVVWATPSGATLRKAVSPYLSANITNYTLSEDISQLHLCADGNLIIEGPSGINLILGPTGGVISKISNADASEIWRYTPAAYYPQTLMYVGDDIVVRIVDPSDELQYMVRIDATDGSVVWKNRFDREKFPGQFIRSVYHPATNEFVMYETGVLL